MAEKSENPYASYPAFEAAFQADFAPLAAEAPYAMAAMEMELRKERAGIAGFAPTAARRSSAERLVIGALLALAQLADRPVEGSGFYMKLDGLADLSTDLRSALGHMGLISLSDERVLGFRRNRQYHALATRGKAFATAMARIPSEGAVSVASDKSLMLRLNNEMQRNQRAIEALFLRQELRLLLSDGDCLPYQRVLVGAARNLRIPFVTIAHGYIQNPFLVSIAPIHGDALITWTRQEREDLRTCLGSEAASKVHYFGYPKKIRRYDPPRGSSLLVVWDPISLKPPSERPRQTSDLLILRERLLAAGFHPRLRLHPKDRRDPDIAETFKKAGVAMSDLPLATEFSQVRGIFGSTSSVIFEGMASGLPCIQIREHDRGFRFPGAASLSLADPEFETKLSAALSVRTDPVKQFDLSAFLAHVTDMMQRHPGR